MERLTQRDMEQILGIYAPFRIKDMALDSEKELLTVHIEEQSSKSRGLFSGQRKPVMAKSWLHYKTGRFDTVIKLYSYSSTLSKAVTLNPPGFIGAQDSNYTYQLQQSVLLAHSKNIDSMEIATMLGLDREIINTIINDANTQQQESQANSQLPLETDPVWRGIINHEISFKTNFSALRFLISKLELSCSNSMDDPSVMQSSVSTLRQFFIKHKNQLKSEYAQIGISLHDGQAESKAPTAQAGSATNNNKKVKLTSDHPIWESILNGEVDLLSKNTGLNLYITQLKSLYKKSAGNAQDQQQIAKELLAYLKKNMAKLKPELLAITKMVKQLSVETTSTGLPDANHEVWEKLAKQNITLDSQQMAYKLLLVKAQAMENLDEAKQLVWQYFDRNQRILKSELSQLESHISMAS